MWNIILNDKKKNDKKEKQIPLYMPLGPPPESVSDAHDIDNKSSNDRVIDVNKEFEIDFDINKEKLTWMVISA